VKEAPKGGLGLHAWQHNNNEGGMDMGTAADYSPQQCRGGYPIITLVVAVHYYYMFVGARNKREKESEVGRIRTIG
jgi:hypothetical protein